MNKFSALIRPKWIIIYTVLFFSMVYFYGRSGPIKGVVLDTKGKPVSGVNIVLATFQTKSVGLLHSSTVRHNYNYFESKTDSDGTFKIDIHAPFWEGRGAPVFIVMKHGYIAEVRESHKVQYSSFGNYVFHLRRPKNAIDQYNSLNYARFILTDSYMEEVDVTATCILVNIHREFKWLEKQGVKTLYSNWFKYHQEHVKKCQQKGLTLRTDEQFPEVVYDAKTIDELIDPIFKNTLLTWQYADRSIYKKLEKCYDPYLLKSKDRASGRAISCLKEFSVQHDEQDLTDLLNTIEINSEFNIQSAYKDFIRAIAMANKRIRAKQDY